MSKEQIDQKLKEAVRLIKECEEIADKTGISFSWDHYQFGGYYNAEGALRKAALSKLTEQEKELLGLDSYDEGSNGWQNSSRNC